MRTLARRRGTTRRSALLATLGLGAWSTTQAQPDFSGVWGMVQHDRLGAPFFIPIEPKLNAAGKSVTEAFVAKYDVGCVEPGMPTVMWGIGGAAMEIVQQPQRMEALEKTAAADQGREQ